MLTVVLFHNAKNISCANLCTKVYKVNLKKKKKKFLNAISHYLTITEIVNFVICYFAAILGWVGGNYI